MKKTIIVIFLLNYALSIGHILGQTTFTFTYDASGNRTDRTILLIKSAIINDTVSNTQKPEQKQKIEDSIGFHVIKIYPNPTVGLLNVEIPFKNEQKISIMVYDLNGKVLIEKIVNDQNTIINLSEHPAGIYILNVIIGKFRKDWKIIKD